MTEVVVSEHDFEKRIITKGKQLLSALEKRRTGSVTANRWLDKFLDGIVEDERFRDQALRFVDVLPALDDDQDLTRHLDEYFSEYELPLTGLLKFGIRHARNGMATGIIARTVRKVITGLSLRFMGGGNAKEALNTAKSFHQRGIGYSLDLLGEATVSEKEAEEYYENYLKILCGNDAPAQRQLNVSLKVSSLYSQINKLDLDGSVAGIARRLRPILLAAREKNAFVCIDMEQYDYKDIILAAFQRLLMESDFRHWDGVGLALQAYLEDTEDDLRTLIQWAERRAAPVTVRLVRGAYWDYETIVAGLEGWRSPVWAQKWQTDACYERCTRLLLAHAPAVRPAIATHNVRSIALAMVLAEARGLSADDFEFQMLYGMARSLEDVIPDLGYRLRIYVPFGRLLPGMAYLVRRLLENSSSQSFQRMSAQHALSPGQLLASPHPAKQTGAAAQPLAGAELTAPAAASDLYREFRNEPRFRFTDNAEILAFDEALELARDGLGEVYPLYIGDREIDTEERLVSRDPATPDCTVGYVAKATTAHADLAVAACREAFVDWSHRSAEERALVLLQIADALRERRREFAALEIFEAGKTWEEADANVTEAIDFLTYYARRAMRYAAAGGFNLPGESDEHDYVPRGIGVIIPPWNFPLAILTGMLSAAVVCGNTVVLKPSSQTPVIAARFVRLMKEAGLPEGVVQFLPGDGGAIGEYLVRHREIHFIAFTGSKQVGARILRLAAELQPGQRHVKSVIAEMGGKNAIIVDSDADMDEAILGTMQSAFGYQGQKCSACSRVIVVGKHYDRFLQRLVDATSSLAIGLPAAPGTRIGPVIDGAAAQRINDYIERGKAEAELALQMTVPPALQGYYVGPAIFKNVAPDAVIAREEIFGPVLATLRARNLEEAIKIANDSDYALTGGLYSRSPQNIAQVKKAFQVGNLYINRKITGALVSRQPFGGFRLSGVGSKAGGEDYLRHFMLPRCITENTLRRGFAPAVCE